MQRIDYRRVRGGLAGRFRRGPLVPAYESRGLLAPVARIRVFDRFCYNPPLRGESSWRLHVNRWLWAGCVIVLLSGCLFVRNAPVLPSKNNTNRGQLIIHSDFDLPDRHRLLEELNLVRQDVHRKLAVTPSDEPVHVYLFETQERFQDYLHDHYPELPARRAFFLETDTQLLVYAHWGDQVAEDLRHEVTHGYLHAVVHNLPLWLDEGLAEYFEVPRGGRGHHHEHVKLLTRLYERDEWRPDLRQLEQLQTLDQMTLLDYAESWLWVHYLMESAPERMDWLRGHIHQLQHRGVARPLSDRLATSEQTLIAHLKSLGERR